MLRVGLVIVLGLLTKTVTTWSLWAGLLTTCLATAAVMLWLQLVLHVAMMSPTHSIVCALVLALHLTPREPSSC